MCCEDPIGGQGGGLNRAALSKAPPPTISRRGMCVHCAGRHSQLRQDGCCLSLPLLSLFSSPHCLHSFPLLFLLPSVLSVILLCTFSPSGRYKDRSCWRERACVMSGRTWAPENYCSGWERQGCRGATKVWILERNRGRRRSRSAERQSRETQKACFQGTDHAGLRGTAAVPGGAPHGKWCQKNQEKRAQSQGEAAHFEDGDYLQFICRLFQSKVLESIWNSGGSVSQSCFHTTRAVLWLRWEVNGLTFSLII